MFTKSKQNAVMIDNEVVARIAQKIRMTRLQKNLTIQQLADRTKVSKGLLSKIENSRTIPSLPVFITLIHSLDISLKEFFNEMVLLNGKDYLLIKRETYSRVDREGREGFEYLHIFSQNIATCSMEAVLLTVNPGAKGRPTTSDGFEFKYMIAGSCDYRINNERIRLEEGDSIYFDASVPHLPINDSASKAIMLVLYFLTPH
jgi:transcriptional regulator with XRE-family HTH domain